METLKILIMNWRDISHPKNGGAEVHINEVISRWVDWGHKVTLLCGKYEGCKEYDLIDGIEIIRKGGPFSVYICAMKEYLTSLMKNDYDYIIDDVNGVPFFTPLYVKKPIVAIMHHLVKDIFFRELSWYQAVFGYTSEKMIKKVYCETPFVTVSKNTKEELVKFGIPKKNTYVVYNGVDHDVYKPNLYQKSTFPLILHIGRVKKYKNIDHLLKAVKNIVESKNIENFKLVIAGRGDFRDVRRQVEEYGISEYVILLGEISEAKKVELLNKAWLFVSASSREGWGLTVIEANACGTPAVAYRVPGLSESIVDTETGFLVPYGEVEGLSKAIQHIVLNETLRKKLSESALNWAKQYDWNLTAEETLKVVTTTS
jgi:glycosyltransferase involved in cell wall biosynthesis